MKKLITTAILLASTASFAHDHGDRPDHYEGQPSETLEQALANFAETNARIAEILAQTEISRAELEAVHQLTYTLENALERIDDEYDALEEKLEELHLATEGADIERARALGRSYLDNAAQFPRPDLKRNG